MPITFAATPADGDVVGPNLLNTNQYAPQTPGSSFADINGELDHNYTNAGWKVRSSLIRNRTLGNGRMVGSTMPSDVLTVLNPSDNTQDGAYTMVHGSGVRFFLPRQPTIMWLTWQIVTASDFGIHVTDNEAIFKAYLDDAELPGQSRHQPPACYFNERHRFTDRIWSGSVMLTGNDVPAAGWHSANIRYWGGGFAIRNQAQRDLLGITDTQEADQEFGGMIRFRVRNMKFLWLR